MEGRMTRTPMRKGTEGTHGVETSVRDVATTPRLRFAHAAMNFGTAVGNGPTVSSSNQLLESCSLTSG